jgi:asparagine synthase (glutamine-hydrolysing)
MCGIAGFYRRDKAAEIPQIQAMCDVIRHRGPDDQGFYTEGGLAIGMRRLSIIDLSTGHQPISNEDGSVWIVFNGEIYNFHELRASLDRSGHRFATATDTEAIVHLYEERGTEGLSQLRGMFAFAIWDRRDRSLLLVRDRFGKKPLYYAALPDGLYFGSELKCLRAAGVPLEPDPAALRHYFRYSYIPDPWSPYHNVQKLRPGCWMRYHADGRIEHGRYWKLPAPVEREDPSLTEQQATTRVRDLFDEAVRMRMIADVPLGAFLSGGIDSSSVVASMALQSKEPVKTFSIGFEEAQFNELPYARMIAAKYRTDHHEIIVKPDSVDLVSRLAGYFDEPFGDSSAIPTYIVSEFARQYVTVVLTGDGGDELFGGYESFFLVDNLRRFDRLPHWTRRGLQQIAEWLPYSAYGKNYLRMMGHRTSLERYFELNYTPYFLRRALLRDAWQTPETEEYLFNTFPDALLPAGTPALTQALYFEATAKLTGDMLVKVDRMSMANSLEVRCPMLDHVLAESAAAIPHRWKLQNGSGKLIFIKAMGDRLPPELVNRPKAGFAVPLPIWFRTSLRSFVHDHLTGTSFRNRNIADPRMVEILIQEHQNGRRNNSHWLWMLLMLELWFRQDEAYAGTCVA